jgi:hypothetical protein
LAISAERLTSGALRGTCMNHLQSALGVFHLIAFAWLNSEDRRAVD